MSNSYTGKRNKRSYKKGANRSHQKGRFDCYTPRTDEGVVQAVSLCNRLTRVEKQERRKARALALAKAKITLPKITWGEEK